MIHDGCGLQGCGLAVKCQKAVGKNDPESGSVQKCNRLFHVPKPTIRPKIS